MLRVGTSSALSSAKRSQCLNQQQNRSHSVMLSPPYARKATFEEAIKEPPKWIPFESRPSEGTPEWKWWMRNLKRRIPRGRHLHRNQQSLHNPFIPDKPLAQRVPPELLKGNPITTPGPIASKMQKLEEKFVSLPVGDNAKFCLDFRVNQHHINYNAVNLEMLRTMRQYFDKWERSGFWTSIIYAPALLQDPKNEHLCAGADIWSLLESPAKAKQFYREQAEMVNELYYMKKPVISFIHGRAHGVGAAMALFQTMPMVTPSAVVSSPGSRIGMSGADAGLSYLFSRLPGHLGEFYLLTGKNITGSDLVTLGLAKFYMKEFESLQQLQEVLSHNESHELHQILEFVKLFHSSPETSKIAYFTEIINDCFSRANVHEIVAALRNIKFKWASALADILMEQDPAVADATLLACRRARFLNIAECLEMEYTLAHHLIDRPNWKQSVQSRLALGPRKSTGTARLWSKPAAETRAAAEALLAPLPKNLRLNLPVRQNLEHYQLRPNYDSEISRSHELAPSRADLHYALQELAPKFRNGKFTRNAVKRYIMESLSDMPELRQQMEAYKHQLKDKSQTLVESGTWGLFSKQTST